MTDRLFDTVPTADEAHDDQREREEDTTPRGVVRAILEQAWPEAKIWLRPPARCLRVLDVCAGFGVWASELRRLAALLGVDVWITGVELDPCKREHLAKWCDEVVIGQWIEALGNDYDLAIGNPHFSALTSSGDGATDSMPEILLRLCPRVLLFHQEQSFQKSKDGCRIWHATQPRQTIHVPGSVRFRNGTNPKTGKPYGADSRCYQATLWAAGHRGPASSVMLPWLSSEARRWHLPPGSEDPTVDLPAVPGWWKRTTARLA
jgi:hypothetical protein